MMGSAKTIISAMLILQGLGQIKGSVLPSFAEPVPNVTVTVGKDALLPCVVDNLGHFKVAWVQVNTQTILTIHTQVISRNPRVTLAQSSHRHWYLRLKNVEPADRGYYMCQVNTNPMRYTSGYLEVLVPPIIVDGGVETEVVTKEGSNITLTCQANGHPEPRITWKREDGMPFAHNGQTVNAVNGEVLHISKASRLHMGPYLCIASNGVPPSVSQRVELKVQFPPMLWIPNQLEAAYDGQDVMLECHIEAYPKSISYWTTSRGDMIMSGEKYDVINSDDSYRVYMRLKIRNISSRDFGTYKCVAKNSLGDTEGTIKLNYVEPPTTFSTSTTLRKNEIAVFTNPIRHVKDKVKKKQKTGKKAHSITRSEAYEDMDHVTAHSGGGDGISIDDVFVEVGTTSSVYPQIADSKSSSCRSSPDNSSLLFFASLCIYGLFI